MRLDGRAVGRAPLEIRNDFEIFRASLQYHTWDSFRYAGPEILADRQFILDAITQSKGYVYGCLPDTMTADSEIAWCAVQQDPNFMNSFVPVPLRAELQKKLDAKKAR